MRYMYNKLFTKILDSSIWLEPTPTRVIWLTFIAVMDEEGFAQFASVANLAHRARISLEETQEAVTCLEGPDPNSSDQDNEGRRIERVPGGWMILNAAKYRDLVTRAISREKTRDRVAKFRASKVKKSVTARNADVTQCNDGVTACNDVLHHQKQTHIHKQIQDQKQKLTSNAIASRIDDLVKDIEEKD